MVANNKSRKLATIVAIDIAGYSARTEADEAKAAAEVVKLRKVIDTTTRVRGGRVFSAAGDGFMLEFGSSLAAVEAALELAEKCRPEVRVGVHLGDVAVQRNLDLLGHGVNVAARLMACAAPGSAVISAPVRQSIRGRIAEQLVSRGIVQLDKMAETIEIFALPSAALANDVAVLPPAVAANTKVQATRTAAPSILRIATLDRIRQSGILRVGVVHYPPISIVDGNDDDPVVSGLLPDALIAMASIEDWVCQFVPLEWGALVTALINREVDMIESVFSTALRLKVCDFGGFVYRIGVSVVVRDDETRVRQHEDLLDQTLKIGVVRGEIGWEYAVEHLGLGIGHRRFRILEESDISRVVELVERGVVDCIIADTLSCKRYCEVADRKSMLKHLFISDPLYVCDCGLMFNKGDDEFATWANRAIRRARNLPQYLEREALALKGYEDVIRRTALK